MREKSTTYLKHRPTGEYVEAQLIDGITIREVELAEVAWKPHFERFIDSLRDKGVPRGKWPQHLHWDWRTKHKRTSRLLAYRWLGIECGGALQGLMLLTTANHFCKIASQLGKELVYLQYLATAPWNSPDIVKDPLYAHIGKNLMAAAVQISQSENFNGRIGLHSLPQAHLTLPCSKMMQRRMLIPIKSWSNN